ncbi:MATE family efflux transporter [Marinifilum fragile]|uniref:lipopolysaccharide biosynthesis protein n=1 Tax=Marinifilum fragile TaxID=570161 RepID=UPI002AAB6FF6|nr:MATE family efflux transporter [Marinifilum fragile]
MGNNTNNAKIARNTMALYIRMGITMIISFISARVILQILGVEDYGLNNVVASVVSLFGFINGSLGTAVQRFYSIEIGKRNESALSRIFSTGLFLHIMVAGITLVIAEIFAIFYLSKLNIPQERMFAAQCVFQISIVSMLLNIVNVPYAALLRSREEFSKIAIFDILQAFLRLGVLYALYQISFDKLITLSLLNFAITLFYVLSLTILARNFKEARGAIKYDNALVKKMIKFISMLIFTVLASLFNKQGIVILVNLFFGLTINAAYAIAFQVSTIVETFAMNFKQSVVPQLMSAYGSYDRVRMNKLMFLGTKITFLLMLIVSIPIMFESKVVLDIWLKEPPRFAATFTALILISANVETFSYFIYNAVHASGNISRQQIFISLSYVLSIIVIFLYFKFGSNFYFAVYVPIVFAIIRNIITVYSAKKAINLDVKYYVVHVVGRSILLSALIVSIAYLITLLLKASYMRLLLILIINALITLLGGYFILTNKEERNSIKSLLLIFVLSLKSKFNSNVIKNNSQVE